MAEYGLRIKNAYGNLVIDGTYANLALVEKLTLSATGSVSGPNGGSYRRSLRLVGYITPVLVIYSPNTVVAHTGSKTGPDTWDFVIHCEAANTPFEVYCFDVASRGQRFPGNYGLVVKNRTSGAVVFDSRCKYMRILDAYVGTAAAGNSMPSSSRNYSAAKVGVCQGLRQVNALNQPLGGSSSDPNHLVIVLFSASGSSGGTVNFRPMQFWVSGPKPLSQNPVVNWSQPGYSYLMVDLSNFD